MYFHRGAERSQQQLQSDAGPRAQEVGAITEVPYLRWLFALALLAFGLYILVSSALGRHQLPGFKQFWWQYLIGAGILAFGGAVLLASPSESLVVTD
jgi:hypothetical protein